MRVFPLVSICITSYNRLNMLENTINSLLERNKGLLNSKDFEIIIVDNKSTYDVYQYLKNLSEENNIEVIFLNENIGNAKATNLAMEKSKGKFIVHLDNDMIVEENNWISQLVEILINNSQIGIIAPDYPGHHLRIHHKDFDEPDYCLGGVWMIRRDVYEKVGSWDVELGRQEECDYSLRIRMAGYIPALCTKFKWTHLDYDHNTTKGSEHVFKFFKKWNEYFLGKPFIYKSPFMLYWDDFPPIAMFRKKVFSIYEVNKETERVSLQGHDCELIRVPHQPNLYREFIIAKCVDKDIQFKESDLETIDRDLLEGRRNWKIEDNT